MSNENFGSKMKYTGRLTIKPVHPAHESPYVDVEVRDTRHRRLLRIRVTPGSLGAALVGKPMQKCLGRWEEDFFNEYESHLTEEGHQEFLRELESLNLPEPPSPAESPPDPAFVQPGWSQPRRRLDP